MGTWSPGPGATEGSDTFTGVDGLDVADGLGGNDVMNGFGSIDQLSGGEGNDTIDGGTGDDIIFGGSGADFIYGGADNDRLSGQTGDDEIHGGAGADVFVLDGGGIDLRYGDEGDDAFYFVHELYDNSPLTGTIDGGDGVDALTLFGQRVGSVTYNSIEVIYLNWLSSSMLIIDPGALPTVGTMYCDDGRIAHASAGVTDLSGLTIIDASSIWHRMEFWGSSGADTFIYAPNSTLSLRADGGAGDDTITAGAGSDELYGGLGIDTLSGGGAADLIYGGGSTNSAADVLNGDGGDDVLVGGSGMSSFFGGSGVDTVNYGLEIVSGSVTIRLDTPSLTGGAALGDAFNSVEVIVGTRFNDAMTGDGSNNTFFGADGNDTLRGGGGNDTLDGGGQSDALYGDGGDDLLVRGNSVVIDGGDGNDTADLGVGGITFDLATATFVSIENIIGSGDIRGDANANVLTGYNGADLFEGRRGADSINGGGGSDTIAFASATQGVIVDLAVGTSWDGFETDTLNSIENIEGTAFNDQFVGTGADNTFTGFAGADAMSGGAGSDTLIYQDSASAVTIDLFNETASGGSAQGDTIQSFENIFGSAHNDVFYANGADNAFNGWLGFDTVSYEFATQGVLVQVNVITASDGTSEDELVSIESIVGSAFNDTILGTSFIEANTYAGGGGDDILQGGAGADTLDGGSGVDTAAYGQNAIWGGVVASLADPSSNTSFAAGDIYISIENLSGSVSGDQLTGDGGDNTLSGEAGDDTLSGGAGADTLLGGDGVDALNGGGGDDTYVWDGVDTVTELAGEGVDTVQASLAYTLGAEVENLTLTGGGAVSGAGNGLINIITGNGAANALFGNGGNDTLDGLDGNDTLDGGLGADAMTGGIGDDTYFVDNGGDVVTENASEGTDTVRSTVGVAALAANVENLVLLGVAVTGNGNALNNTITGNASNNSINGQAGADTMAGGLGNDTYFVDDLADAVVESAGQGTDIIFSTVNVAALAANVENLTISALALTATGNALNNTIAGNAQNNTLNGGSGEDTLIGGIGNDLYIVNSLGDVVTEGLGAGTDSILAFINIDALVANVENVTLAGAATSATGNELSNILTGNGLDNTLVGGLGGDQLNGGTGADTLSGGGGDDAYLVENAGDVVIELGGEGNNDIVYAFISLGTLADNVERVTITGTGNLDVAGNSLGNRVNGNANNNVLLGLDGNDVIQGLAGTDTINGGGGLDLMTGGADADTFVFSLVSDSGTTGATRDVINDFAQGSDIISLTGIDAITGGGDDAFTLIGTAAFSNTAGELRYDQIDNPTGNDFTILSLDVNGDGIADSQITLIGLVTLTVSDFGL